MSLAERERGAGTEMTMAPNEARQANPTANVPGRMTLLALLASATLTVMAGATISPSLPGLVAEFSDDKRAEWLVPFVLTAPGLAIAIAAPLAGVVVDRTVKRRTLVLGILLYTAAGSTGLYLDTLNAILAGRLALGVAVGMIMTAAMALIADLYAEPERSRVLGWQAAAMGLGGVVFVGAGGLLGALDWRAPFAVYLAPLALLPVILASVPALPPRPRGSRESSAEPFPWRHAIPIYALAAASMLSFYVIPTLMPFVIAEMAGTERSAPLTGLAVAASTLAAALLSFQYGRIRKRVAPPVVASASFVFVAVGYAVVATGPTYPVLVAALALVGAALGLIMPNNNAWLLSRIPDAMRGRASGMMTMSVFLAQFSSAFVGAFLVDVGGLAFVYLAASVFAGAIALLMAFVAARSSTGQTGARTLKPRETR